MNVGKKAESAYEANSDLKIDNQEVFDKWLNAKGLNAFNNPSIAICIDQETGNRTAHLLCTDYNHIRGETLAFSPREKEKLEENINKQRKRKLLIVSFWWRDGEEIKNQSFE
jgi:hypothetical protein